MIAVRPDATDPLPWRVLCEVVAAPGELRSDDLAEILTPVRVPDLTTGPVTDEWRRLGLAPVFRTADDWRTYGQRLAARRRAARARLSSIMRRLVAQGFVEHRRELVTVSAWGRLRIEAVGIAAAIEGAIADEAEPTDDPTDDLWTGGVYGKGEDEEEDEADEEEPDEEEAPEVPTTHLTRLLTTVVSSPIAPAALMLSLPVAKKKARKDGKPLRPSGAGHRAYARLAELGLITTPSHRWPTPAGIAMVASLSEKP